MKNLLIILLLSHTILNAQNYFDSLKSVEDSFKSFKYAEVIKRTPTLLKYGAFSPDTLINIYMMKGISHYALQEDTLAKNSFFEILKMDSSYNPDSVTISPKIISFFSAVKQQYVNTKIVEPVEVKDTTYLIKPDETSYLLYNQKMKSTIARSLIFPGLGHIYAEDSKGWYISTAAGLSLISSIYFAIDAENKKKNYLNEQDITLISTKYDEYNFAYQARNISFVVYGALWIFAQIDLLTSSILDFTPETITIYSSSQGTVLSFNIKF